MIRCPVCRAALEATDEAWDAHFKTHSTWGLIRHGWRSDRHTTTLLIVFCVSALSLAGVVVAASGSAFWGAAVGVLVAGAGIVAARAGRRL